MRPVTENGPLDLSVSTNFIHFQLPSFARHDAGWQKVGALFHNSNLFAYKTY